MDDIRVSSTSIASRALHFGISSKLCDKMNMLWEPDKWLCNRLNYFNIQVAGGGVNSETTYRTQVISMM